MKRTVGRLADGREILWFDRDEGVVRDTTDRRSLPPTATTSQIRYDAVLDEWVAIASHRQDRTFLPPADLCPLCPSREGRLTEVPSDDYDVVVFENRFPSFSTDITGVEDNHRSGRPVRHPTGVRPVRGRVLHQRPLRIVRAAEPRPGSPRRRSVGGPHRRPQCPRARRAGLSASRIAASRSA